MPVFQKDMIQSPSAGQQAVYRLSWLKFKTCRRKRQHGNRAVTLSQAPKLRRGFVYFYRGRLNALPSLSDGLGSFCLLRFFNDNTRIQRLHRTVVGVADYGGSSFKLRRSSRHRRFHHHPIHPFAARRRGERAVQAEMSRIGEKQV